MASCHVNRANRPNTWPLRPTPQSEDSPCQPGAVHTWPIADDKRKSTRLPIVPDSGTPEPRHAQFRSAPTAMRERPHPQEIQRSLVNKTRGPILAFHHRTDHGCYL